MSELAESLKKCKVDGNTLFLPAISDGMLPNYAEVRKALLNAGAKYAKNKFVFSSDAKPFVDKLMGGETVNIKKSFQWFPTPPSIARELVLMAEMEPNHSVLEPSAGQGAIVRVIHESFPDIVVDCCELMEENQMVLSKIPGSTLICADFLKINDEWLGKFDRVIANPPFNKNQDISHIKKMFQCLKKGGRLVSIASKHWQFARGKKEMEFKEWLEDIGAEIHDIEAGKFKESGTMVSCCIIVIDK